MVMLRGKHSTERGEGNTEKDIMTELPRRVWFFTETAVFLCRIVEKEGVRKGWRAGLRNRGYRHEFSFRYQAAEDCGH